jgi:hypothetical protein
MPTLRLRTVATVSLALFAAIGFTGRASAQQASPAPSASPAPGATDDRWHFRVTPYLWLPTINAQFHFLHPTLPSGAPAEAFADVRVGPNQYLSHLNSAAQLTVEADKGSSFVFGDLIYLNLGNGSSSVVNLGGPLGHINIPIDVSTTSRTTSTLATVGIGNAFVHTDTTDIGAFVGLRYINMTANVTWNVTGPLGLFPKSGSASGAQSNLQAIVGGRGRIGLGSNWYVPLYLDYGGSGDLTTYQWLGGIAHSYHSGAQILVWRQLAYFQNNNGVLINNVHLGGPAFAWSFYL